MLPAVLTKILNKYRPRVQELSLLGTHINIVEVGPRDGLQNQKQILTLQQKVKLIDALSHAGLKSVEVGSFVSPKWIPQMANSKQLYNSITKLPGVRYPCLVPNEKGLQEAIAAGVTEVAIFASSTEGFSRKNLNCSVKQSLDKYKVVSEVAQKNKMQMRGYVSMVMGCPYDGEVEHDKVKYVVQRLFELGCYEVSLGDTIGKGTPEKTVKLLESLHMFPKEKIALHFHDTFNTALENILEGICMGYRTVDCSVAGLGGCPYSMKPVGNVCTENVVYTLQQLGLKTGVDSYKLSAAGDWISSELGRKNLRLV